MCSCFLTRVPAAGAQAKVTGHSGSFTSTVGVGGGGSVKWFVMSEVTSHSTRTEVEASFTL